MLGIVVTGVAGVIAGMLAGIQRGEIDECAIERRDVGFSIQIKVDATDCCGNGCGGGGLYTVGDIVVTAPLLHTHRPVRAKKPYSSRLRDVLNYTGNR